MIVVKTKTETKEFEDREIAVWWIIDQFEREGNMLVSRGIFTSDGSVPPGDRDDLPRLYTQFSIELDARTGETLEVAKLYDPEDANRNW